MLDSTSAGDCQFHCFLACGFRNEKRDSLFPLRVVLFPDKRSVMGEDIVGGDAMELSILVARIIALVYLSASLGGFLSGDYHRRLWDDMYKNAALMYLMGFLAVIVGCLMVHYHNRWVGDWTVLIAIIGLLSLAEGTFIIVLPKYFQRATASFRTEMFLTIVPYGTLAMGLLFAYFGFVQG